MSPTKKAEIQGGGEDDKETEDDFFEIHGGDCSKGRDSLGFRGSFLFLGQRSI